MGVCLPKHGSAPKKDGEMAEQPVPAKDESPGSPKSSPGPGGDSPRSPKHGHMLQGQNMALGDLSLEGERETDGPQAPAPPVKRKNSLQIDAADMSHLLTQMSPGTPMSPGGRRDSPQLSPSPQGSALLPAPTPDMMGKRCLVIDLDETLVHTERQPSGFAGGRYDFKISVKVGATTFPMYVAKRPYCDEFLRKASQNYELIIFTASVEAYCSAVMEKIDPHGYVAHCLDRTHCTFYQQEIYVKDLSRLGRVLRDTILLDNNADCYLFQPDNAIPINSWYDDTKDTDLQDVLGILDLIAGQKKSAVATLAEIDQKLGWQRKG